MFIDTDELVDHFRCGVGSDSLISDWIVKGRRRERTRISGTLGDGLRKRSKDGDTLIYGFIYIPSLQSTDSIHKQVTKQISNNYQHRSV